ncbi:glucose 1-dehydrogenase [Aminobacter sp. MSH1]|uniref:SDR family NAD(P)-dependent oxidoreductase n=1 Tax=Aminobacter sp. MSH1 TaxID=374606 RepID=UPI000D393A6A|nr:glucose 1-dehydrogenase [Aminobacter sp. MSH1]
MDLFKLDGRVAVITGGNGGIGLEMARGLAAAGATPVLVGRNRDKGKNAVAALKGDGFDALFFEADVTSESECRKLVASIVEKCGGVDILINNAGIAIRKTPEDYSEADWKDVIDTNLSSAFYLSQAVFDSMKARGGGKIINIASILAVFGAPFSVAYSASKGGLVQFTRALATAWASSNIQVNAILPGWIDTDLTVSARSEVAGLAQHVIDRTPAKRWGRPEELAGPVVFLASSASDFVTGASLTVDGGFSVQA